MKDAARWATVTVVVHTVVVSVHAGAHQALQILPSGFDAVFIGVVFYVAPVVSALLLRSRPGVARPLLFVSMLAGLLYGATYHYILPTPDNVALVASVGWGLVFQATTVVLAVLEPIGVAIGIILLRTPRPPSPGA